MTRIVQAGNTVVPGLLALEQLGFVVTVIRDSSGERISARNGDVVCEADDPIAVLGLARLLEIRGDDWRATDAEIDAAFARHALDK
ncbi:MAG: hypothetical protein HYR85_20970 [Planctomycetes bacterium]|nr:hypothetical protein [Planctomycetota bacterium]MBI3844910.1 hypothetical protein [Planctomycetota bacterium]